MQRLVFTIAAIALVLPQSADAQQSRNGHRNQCTLTGIFSELPYEDLDHQEISDLSFMREEEKLARDVYLSLFEEWELKIFRQIPTAERTHMRAVLFHLRKYELGDPASGNGVGAFIDPDLQALYGELVQLGMVSVEEALKVGAMIEELDIRDLQRALAHTDNQDLQSLYQNLMKGSRNHLRAFHKVLTRFGATYDPSYLTEGEYNEIVTSPRERGVVDADGETHCGGRGRRQGSG